ncbi:MAG: hypothetical protein ACREU6_10190 [Steroidobacteraceae bacterium]
MQSQRLLDRIGPGAEQGLYAGEVGFQIGRRGPAGLFGFVARGPKLEIEQARERRGDVVVVHLGDLAHRGQILGIGRAQ